MNSTTDCPPALPDYQIAANDLAALWVRLEAVISNEKPGLRAVISRPTLRDRDENPDFTAPHVEVTVTFARGFYSGHPAPEYAAKHFKAPASESFVWHMGLACMDWKAEAKKGLRMASWHDDSETWRRIRQGGAQAVSTRTLLTLAPSCLHAFVAAVKPVEVLACVCRDAQSASQPFDSWAADLGLDTDSRKALATYMACQEQGTKARRLIDHATFERLADLSGRL